MKSLIRLLKLPHGDRVLLLQTAVLLNAVRLGLWLLPFQKLCRLLNRCFPLKSNQTVEPHQIDKVIWAVEAVSWHLPGRRVLCLARALATQALLHQLGCDCELRIGVAKSPTGKLEAHAWVEHDGKLIIGGVPGLNRFMPLPSLEMK